MNMKESLKVKVLRVKIERQNLYQRLAFLMFLLILGFCPKV